MDKLPLSASACSSLVLSNKTIISPIMKKKKPQQNPVIGEYPLFLCIKAQTIPVATNIIIGNIVIENIIILISPFDYRFCKKFFC